MTIEESSIGEKGERKIYLSRTYTVTFSHFSSKLIRVNYAKIPEAIKGKSPLGKLPRKHLLKSNRKATAGGVANEAEMPG